MGKVYQPGELPMQRSRAQADLDRDIHERIGRNLQRHGLRSTPDNYMLMHAIVTSGNEKLRDRINQILAKTGEFSERDAAIICKDLRRIEMETVAATTIEAARKEAKAASEAADRNADGVVNLSSERMASIVEGTKTILASMSSEISRTGADAKGYATGLQGLVEQGGSATEDLIALTLTMIENARQTEMRMNEKAAEMAAIQQELDEARSNAAHDPLTGLPNRRTLDSTLKAAVRTATSGDADLPLAVAIIDIDHFKSVNDTYGHLIGDQVIKVVAKLLTEVQGDRPFVGRYGGEEFVMVFEGITPEEARQRIDEVRERLGKMRLRCTDTGREINRITFSAGVSGTPLRRTATEMLQSADKAMYRSKHDGRNLVSVAGRME